MYTKDKKKTDPMFTVFRQENYISSKIQQI